MKQYKTTIVDGYVLIADDSEIEFWYLDDTGIIRRAVTMDKKYWSVRKEYKKIIAHLPLNNSIILQGVPLLPPIQQEDDVYKLAEEYANELPEPYNYGINPDKKAGYISGYNKAKELFRYTEEDLRKTYSKAFSEGVIFGNSQMLYKYLTVSEYIQSLQQPKLPIAFNCEMKQKFEADKSKRKDINNGVYYLPKTISTPNGEQWIGEWS